MVLDCLPVNTKNQICSRFRLIRVLFSLRVRCLIRKKLIISPTHKRTEGRAPVWGSDFISKDAALQRGPAETAARLNVKLCVLTGGGGDWWHLTPFSKRNSKADTEIKSRRGAGHSRGIRVVVGLCFCFAPCRPLPRPRRPLPPSAA